MAMGVVTKVAVGMMTHSSLVGTTGNALVLIVPLEVES